MTTTVVPPVVEAADVAAPAWHIGTPLTDREFFDVRRRAIFECCKWDPQMQDVSVLAPFPLLITASTWDGLASAARPAQ